MKYLVLLLVLFACTEDCYYSVEMGETYQEQTYLKTYYDVFSECDGRIYVEFEFIVDYNGKEDKIIVKDEKNIGMNTTRLFIKWGKASYKIKSQKICNTALL